MKQLNWLVLMLAMIFMMDASAILLDCAENSDGTYLCIKLDEPAELSRIPQGKAVSGGYDQSYLERAKKHCEYREPVKRGGKTASSATRKMEARKAAREEYDRCVINKAHEFMNADKTKEIKEN